jgi:hypothetical protein
MKAINYLICAAALASGLGFSQSLLDQKPRSAGRLVSENIRFNQVLWWNGVHYQISAVSDEDEETITFQTDRGLLKVPWEKLPDQIKNAFQDARARDLKERAQTLQEADLAAKTAEKKDQGWQEISGLVVQTVNSSLLIDLDGQTILVRGAPAQADGDRVVAWVKPDGLFQYTTVMGATATVHAFKYESPPD